MARVGGRSPVKADKMMLRAEIQLRERKGLALLVISCGAALAIVLLAMWPIANSLAGKTTGLNLNIALTFTVGVSLVGLGAVAYARQQKKRADEAEKRNRRLSRDVKELQQRLTDAGLSPSVSR